MLSSYKAINPSISYQNCFSIALLNNKNAKKKSSSPSEKLKAAGSNLNQSQFGGRDLELDEASKKIQMKKRKVLKVSFLPGSLRE